MKKILVIGSLNMDMVVNVDHAPKTGETILCNEMELVPGGKGANQACALGRLGADVVMLGAIGQDLYGYNIKKNLSESGVDVSFLSERTEVNTGIAMITVNRDGDNCIVVVSGANNTMSSVDIDEKIDLIKKCDIVIFQLEIPMDTVLYAAKTAKKYGKMVILDPAPASSEFPDELFSYVDLIKPNETELCMLAGVKKTMENIPFAIEKLRQRGAGDILVTLGEKGVYIDQKNKEIVTIPAQNVKAVDTTAAGDSFTGALAMMLAEGKTLVEAATFANQVSAIVVTRKGAQSSIPRMNEVEAYIKK